MKMKNMTDFKNYKIKKEMKQKLLLTQYNGDRIQIEDPLIEEEITELLSKLLKAPEIILDYMQIIEASNPRGLSWEELYQIGCMWYENELKENVWMSLIEEYGLKLTDTQYRLMKQYESKIFMDLWIFTLGCRTGNYRGMQPFEQEFMQNMIDNNGAVQQVIEWIEMDNLEDLDQQEIGIRRVQKTYFEEFVRGLEEGECVLFDTYSDYPQCFRFIDDNKEKIFQLIWDEVVQNIPEEESEDEQTQNAARAFELLQTKEKEEEKEIYEIILEGKNIKIDWNPGIVSTRFYMQDSILILDYYCFAKDKDEVYRYKCEACTMETSSQVKDGNRMEVLELTYNVDANYYDEEQMPIGEPQYIEDGEIKITSDGIAEIKIIYQDPITKDYHYRQRQEQWFESLVEV